MIKRNITFSTTKPQILTLIELLQAKSSQRHQTVEALPMVVVFEGKHPDLDKKQSLCFNVVRIRFLCLIYLDRLHSHTGSEY